jgi:hypothetical protein
LIDGYQFCGLLADHDARGVVLALTILGVTLASATRRPSTTITFKRGSTTLPIRRVDGRWYTVCE